MSAMDEKFVVQGRELGLAEIQRIRQLIAENPHWSRPATVRSALR